MKKRKILFYTDSFNKGGTEKATLDLINSLDDKKYDITLIQFFSGGMYKKQLKKSVHKKHIIPLPEHLSAFISWRSRIFVERLNGKLAHKLLIGNKYDVEIGCGYGYPTKLVSFSPNAKRISWIHMDVSLDKNNIAQMSREEGQEYFKNIDEIVCVSKDCRNSFVEKFGLEDKTCVKYNIVLSELIEERAKEEQVAFEKDYINLVSIGRLTWQKGYDRLIEAVNIVESEKIKIYIIGEGPDKEKLEEEIEKRNLGNNIKLLGFQENPYPYVKRADYYICTSRFEGLSLAVEESIVLGTPVISTNCTGANEILGNGEYGLIVDNSVEGLVKGLKKILEKKELLEIYRKKTKERRDFFDKKKLLEEWEKIII